MTRKQKMQTETPGDTLRNLEAKALPDKLGDMLPEVKALKVGETLTALNFTSPVLTLAPMLAEIRAETAGKSLSDVEAPALVYTFSATQTEVVAKTNWGHTNLFKAGGIRRNAN